VYKRQVQAQIFEGLVEVDAQNHVIPATAERWEISDDGLTYIFFLRPQARWSNGDPVTAYDFEYAWKSTLNPDLASSYAYQLYYLKNGEAYNKRLAPPDAVGVKALDEHTLRVVLEQPTAYFLNLLSFHTYYPVPRRIVENNPNWANDPKTLIGNGPFKITAWVHNSQLDFSRNEYYWDASSVKMDRMEFILTDSSTTVMALFENGQIDMGEGIPPSELPRLRRENKVTIFPYLGTYYYVFNVTKPPFNDWRVRKAFTLAINREAIVKNITQGDQKPALAWVPYGLADKDPGTDFRIVGGNYFQDNDIETAQKLLSEAGYPGGRGLPPITLLYNTSESHKAIAEAVQEMWKKNLGASVRLVNQEWKVYLDTRNRGDFQVARASWIGDYADPMTFLDLFETGGGNNDAKYSNPQYDLLIKTAKTTTDQAIRMRAMHEAEKLLMTDAVIAPIYFYTNPVLVKPYVKGYVRSILGHLYFKRAYLERK